MKTLRLLLVLFWPDALTWLQARKWKKQYNGKIKVGGSRRRDTQI